MKDWVKYKLERINELFPSERIKLSKERIERLWSGKKPLDRYPFVFIPITFEYYNDVHTPEERLKASLDEIIFRGRFYDDFIPTIFPGCKQSTIPSMFGAKEVVSGKDYCSERIIFENEGIDRMPEPDMGPGTTAYEWLSMQQYILEETEGQIPIHVTDMQGPVDVCGQLWGYDNILASAYTDPEYFHKIMSIVTDAFIMFWKKQKEILCDCFVGTHLFGWNWVPEDTGASISADSLVMVSPDYYNEFYRPYLTKIGEVFGGMSVHSCGNFAPVFKNLCRTPFLKAINASQMSIEQLLDAGLDSNVLVVAAFPISSVEKTFKLIKKYSLRVDPTITEVFPMQGVNIIHPGYWTEKDWDSVRRNEEKVMEGLTA